MDYVKLSQLVDKRFTIEHVWGYKFKMWDNETKKMIVEDTYHKGFRKVWEVDTDKGKVDLSSSQLGSLLECVFQDGLADINGASFEVKSNGKQGMDIRYFFNPAKAPTNKVEEPDDDTDQIPL